MVLLVWSLPIRGARSPLVIIGVQEHAKINKSLPTIPSGVGNVEILLVTTATKGINSQSINSTNLLHNRLNIFIRLNYLLQKSLCTHNISSYTVPSFSNFFLLSIILFDMPWKTAKIFFDTFSSHLKIFSFLSTPLFPHNIIYFHDVGQHISHNKTHCHFYLLCQTQAIYEIYWARGFKRGDKRIFISLIDIFIIVIFVCVWKDVSFFHTFGGL